MKKIVIDPMTRVEGHLRIEALVDDGKVKECRSSGTLFRGFELFLKGRDPRDAQSITQRICGVCPTAHGIASALNLDSAFGIDDKIPDNGRIIRNLILGSNYIQSHILHFYHLAALDYVDVTSLANFTGSDTDLLRAKNFLERGQLGPFVPRYEGDYRLSKDANIAAVGHYLEALKIRRLAHEMLAIFGGKMPHVVGVVPGGVTCSPTTDKITDFLWRLNRCRDFIDGVYISDVLAVAEAYSDYFEIGRGCNYWLSYGVFDQDTEERNPERRKRLLPSGVVDSSLSREALNPIHIAEDVLHSWFAGEGRKPVDGQTEPNPEKKEAYSWIKAPRYDGKAAEVGPIARVLNAYLAGDKKVKKLVDAVLEKFHAKPNVLFSVLGRHAARALECKFVADAMAEWVLQLKPGEPVYVDYELPDEAEGIGLTEAPRGALGHWMKIKNGKIDHYELVVPTTWNASPKDAKEQPGPIEQAILDTKISDPDNPFEIVRIVRSFDPCLACAVHLINFRRDEIGRYRIN
ncbi:MAG: nickel-dependent hydrogenase large subunit [Spirochaetaceae bacterium]|nr:MAG: nickel-dependent hydrogenase large subunit [Spirochaetaceae bacterium]